MPCAAAGPAAAKVSAIISHFTSFLLTDYSAIRTPPHLTLDHPVSQALLNPALMRVLLTKVTPQNQASLMGALASRLRQVSLVSATQAGNQQGQGQPDQPRPAGQRFAVRQNDLAAVARPGAASYATALNALAR